MLGVSMNGIESVLAEPMEEARKCKICRTQRPYSSDMLDKFRHAYSLRGSAWRHHDSIS
jgi:hypothetical protein